ncbi:MAG: dihydrodipicolinate reductase [Bacilli bacterium]|nr:dihydrodipicolinate reductase [Bacilli bacterium]
MTKIKVVQIGCGKMSKYTMRYVYEKGAEIVGAVDINPEVIGKDIAYVMGGDNKGVKIDLVENLNTVLENTKPDIAIVTTMSLLNDIEDVLRVCASNGVNAITTCEEAFFSSNSNPTLHKELDLLAKANNCTITGCGYQDIFWGNLITVLAGSTHRITKIKGSSSYNVEDYGIALAKAHGAGLTLEEFEREVAAADNISTEERNNLINNREFLPSYMWNTVGWLADKLNLTIESISQKCVPITYEEDLHSETLQMDIKAGLAIGMSAVVKAETKEGIILEAECIGKVYAPDVFDKNEWTVYGEPDTSVVVDRPCTVELTCADIVNRIPDVINAKPGFIPTSQMDDPKYRVKPLDSYLK